jgi:hypothetical protein
MTVNSTSVYDIACLPDSRSAMPRHDRKLFCHGRFQTSLLVHQYSLLQSVFSSMAARSMWRHLKTVPQCILLYETLPDADVGNTDVLGASFLAPDFLTFRHMTSKNLWKEGIIHWVVYNGKQIQLWGTSAQEQRDSWENRKQFYNRVIKRTQMLLSSS